MSELRPAIVVSRCLMGEAVRYDGSHKHAPQILAALTSRFALIPVCPEVEAGMPTPRETMDFQGDARRPAVIGKISRRDFAPLLHDWSSAKLAELAGSSELAVCGFFLKFNSPSCAAVTRKPVFDLYGRPRDETFGIFAGLAMRAFPGAAIGDEFSLATPQGLENFMALAQAKVEAQDQEQYHRATQESAP
ncbi:MAG: DUF523 domain-containing protein [Desulfocurvibacter africanus]